LSCEQKLHARRDVLDDYCINQGMQIVSLANVPSLGTTDHIILDDKDYERQVNENKNDLS